MMMKSASIAAFALATGRAAATIYDFAADCGAVVGDDSVDTCWKNGGILNETLAK